MSFIQNKNYKMKLFPLISVFLFLSFFLSAQEKTEANDPPVEKVDDQSIDEVSDIVNKVSPPPEKEFKLLVEEMPRFPGCEDLEADKRKACADQKMLRFVYGNLEYPKEARKNKTEGSVVIRFYVGKDGTINEPTILKDIGDGCGEEALRIIKSMPIWIPAINEDGENVKVYFNLPIRFRLK